MRSKMKMPWSHHRFLIETGMIEELLFQHIQISLDLTLKIQTEIKALQTKDSSRHPQLPLNSPQCTPLLKWKNTKEEF